jgi:hypothetical protein
VFWDYVRFPEFWAPRRIEQLNDHMVYWIDPQRRKALEEAMRSNTPLPLDPELDKDFYGIRTQAAAAAAAAASSAARP